ncbi:MAG: DotU family type IV/VI secretion system protein [Planctomycetes bacterium]|nr:DotU family type IV/VI secretion system protein [Planctomycetota bacterium]
MSADSRTGSQAVDRGTLADHCAGVVKLACGLDGGSDADALFAQFDASFADFEARVMRAGLPLEDARDAKYALCALIDERVMSSTSPAREGWSANPLQLRYFDEFAAGEVFFDRVDELRSMGSRRIEVLEVYGICLALGFTGKHTGERGADRRRALLDHILHDLGGSRAVAVPRREQAAHAGLRSEVPLWIAPLATAGVVLLVYLLVQAWVRAEVDSFARDLSLGQGTHGS